MSMTNNRPPLTSWEHLFIDVSKEEDRYTALHSYLNTCVRPGERVIIFRSHGPKAIKVALTLRALGHNAAPVAGRMSESERKKIVQMYSDGNIPILVCTEIASSSAATSGASFPRADHVINYGFHWSSAAANAKEYIARADKGNGRIVSFVTIADSVTLQYLSSSLSFKMREVELEISDTTKTEVSDVVNKEHVRVKEQDKLSSMLSSSTSSSLTTTSSSSVSQHQHHQHQSCSFSSSASTGGMMISPQDAMRNISNVMKKYQEIHNDDQHRHRHTSFDDDDSDRSSHDDDDNDDVSNQPDFIFNRDKPSKIKLQKLSLAGGGGSAQQKTDDGINISPLRSRRSRSLPRDNHGLHGHVQLPNYAKDVNRSGSPFSPEGDSNTTKRASSKRQRRRSASRGRGGGSGVASCLPRQLDESSGKFKLDQGPFVPRPGDEALVEMIEAEMNLGHVSTSFDDIAGQEHAKQLLQEAVILPTLMPNFFQGIRRPTKGALLYGPPGTGKTLLARAVANSAKTTFFAVSPATLTSKWRGESEKLIRVLYEMARHYAPSTIFIDEVDSLCSCRGSGNEHEASRRAKSMLLQEMDGLTADPAKVVMTLGATNFPNSLDSAFLRRFEQRIYIPLPTLSDRESLFKLNMKGIIVGEDVRVAELSQMLEGKCYSCADITTVIRDAAMRPMRRFMYGDNNNSSSDENKSFSSSMVLRRDDVFKNPQKYEDELSKLPVTMQDFKDALKSVPSSVKKDQITMLEDWRAQFSI